MNHVLCLVDKSSIEQREQGHLIDGDMQQRWLWFLVVIQCMSMEAETITVKALETSTLIDLTLDTGTEYLFAQPSLFSFFWMVC